MITKFKLFEDVKEKGDKFSEPEEGDYVICSPDNFAVSKNIVKNNIGQIARIEDDHNSNLKKIYINYDLSSNLMAWNNEIIYWSKNKKELEPYIAANKYNL